MIKVCVVKERVDQEVRDLPNRYVEIGNDLIFLHKLDQVYYEVSCHIVIKATS